MHLAITIKVLQHKVLKVCRTPGSKAYLTMLHIKAVCLKVVAYTMYGALV